MGLQKEPDMPAEVPVWLMTFSDVITLLMTFFILLLTFATSEPEKFERMQISMFQGGGAMGIAADAKSAQDQDALIMRQRPKSGRISVRGSEIPPIDADATTSSLSEGIAGLAADEQRELSTNHAMRLPMSFFFNSDGGISAQGEMSARMLARQMRNQPLDISFSVTSREDLEKAQSLAAHIYEKFAIQPGRIGVGYDRSPTNNAPTIKLRMTLPLDGQADGS